MGKFVSFDIATESRKGPTNCFEICINFMFGDADSYTSETFHYSDKMRDEVLGLANFLDELSVYSNPYSRKPEKHPEFSKYVLNESDDSYWLEEEGPNGNYYSLASAKIEFWPNDPDGWGVAKVDSFVVNYIDENGSLYSVTFNEAK